MDKLPQRKNRRGTIVGPRWSMSPELAALLERVVAAEAGTTPQNPEAQPDATSAVRPDPAA